MQAAFYAKQGPACEVVTWYPLRSRRGVVASLHVPKQRRRSRSAFLNEGVNVLGYDFPLLSMFWVLVWWFLLLTVFVTVIYAFIDNFRRHDHHGWAKAGWALLILIVPLLGTLIYLIARPADPLSVA